MAVNFPNSPSVNDTFTSNGVTFEWNGTAWKLPASPGVKGLKGDIGEKGQKGEKGNKGDKGEKGQKGEVGQKGQKGEKGEKGQKGEVGLSGGAGSKGQKGEKGEVGAQGSGGSAGDKGQKGEVGPTGADNSTKGQKGEVGATGGSGSVGSQGIKGQKGEVGAGGSTGATGAQGPQGNTGPTGPTGPQGPTGAQGPTGPTSFNGSIRNVATNTKTGAWSLRYYNSTVDVGLLTSLTPNDNSNKILVRYFVYCGGSGASFGTSTTNRSRLASYLQRRIGGGGWSTVFQGNQGQGSIPLIPSVPGGPSNNTYTYITGGAQTSGNQDICLLAHEYLDSPGTTQQVQYRVLVQGANHGGSYSWYLTLGRSYTTGWGNVAQAPCSLTAMELEA